MTRLEFLTRLENGLQKQLPKQEISAIMRNVIDYFNENERRGKRELQITKELGDPQRVATQMTTRSRIGELIKKPTLYHLLKAQWSLRNISLTGFFLGLLITIPVLLMVAVFVFSIIVILFSGITVIAMTFISLARTPIALFFFLIFFGMTLIGFAITLSYILRSITRKVVYLSGKLFENWYLHSKKAKHLMIYEGGVIHG